jgi:diaminohydroxyphosphoribosylaminopyrimidine deaminase / 5-amino-6-(5-phosphoribosylamino)uracil reductase
LQNNHDYLLKALTLAKTRQGFCAPNPAVGAVVVKDNRIVGEGYHYAAGHPHAEVEAIKQAGAQAKGATLYVTLEPCCHHGRTPPCTDLIIKTAINNVYYAFADPNPEVAGQGKAILEQSGIGCELINIDEVTEFYRAYQFWWQHQTPLVTAKIALSADGKIAGGKGKRLTITGGECQQFTHEQRKKHDAILTTINTIINDDPQLNVRLNKETIKKPLFILDGECRLPLSAKVWQTCESMTIFHRQDAAKDKIQALTEQGARCIGVAGDNKGLNLQNVLQIIGQDGYYALWVEAGGHCFQNLWQQHLLQRAFIYYSTKTLGDKAMPAFSQTLSCDNSLQMNLQAAGEDTICEILFD